ncbi:restriction endonuclease subunit S [Acidithiobacillus ferrooxidans]|jgi:type I restriction enzyme S subunit|uniref:restriction endonuclease subunit S n=1 Tax=Acidithiobacillus ferrooxidans TaxID=920 RepID=UPI001C06E85B|nr:restriction endonuclease subunit S [Acidithiobacillus ferrooxidans]MBU2808064.1 hypothetical protein [Acidithiobacillus ferrooxidans F221]UBU61965.1 restriction endonuclease subunit S [Acidithiobacillus ferrooxidans]
MTAGWQDKTWGEIATLEYGKSLRDYIGSSGKFPVFGTNGQIGWHTEALYEEPSVIVGRKGAYRGIHYSRTPFFVIDTAFYLKPKMNFDTKWAYYELLTHDINAMDSGSAIPSTSRDEFYSLDVRVPSIKEQRRIAHILGTLDDKIENNRKTAKTLEAMAQAIFKSWFVDFDPVRAKMAGESPDSICKRLKLTPEILDLFPDRLVDSELGEIPEGWGISPLGDLIELAYGKPLKAENRTQGRVPVYGSNGIIGWHDVKLVNGPGIVVGRKGNPGTVIWVEGEFYPIDTTFYVIPKNGVGLRFLYHALMRHDLTALGADSAVPGLNRNLAYISKQLVPHANLCTAFENLTEILFLTSNNLKKQSMDSIEIRDALLPKLISGDIRVQESTLQIEDTLT